MDYDRLLAVARAMHCWIFLHSFDEDEVYKELGITPEENAILGSAGRIELRMSSSDSE